MRSVARSWCLTAVASMIVCVILTGPAFAVAPSYVPDEELAKYPIVVVAKWTKKPLENHNLVERNELKKYEVRTEIEVLRSLRGKIKPGKYDVLLGFMIGWEREGGPVMCYMSSERMGDVKEVCDAQLWFLREKRSWDPKDEKVYLELDTYRGVQPLVLENYFVALGSADPEKQVPKLVSSQDGEVVRRVLQYLNGGKQPWPTTSAFDEMFDEGGKATGRKLREHADAVAALLDRKDPAIRCLAAATYAELKGKESVELLRKYLADEDPWVRGVVLAVLARHRDVPSLDAMADAALRNLSPTLGCNAVKELADWKDPKVVPVLISMLEDDAYGGMYGDDLFIPALKAQAALHDITNHWFPFDVVASRAAWEEARKAPDDAGCQAVLERLIPFRGDPLAAEVIGTPMDASIRVKNVSKRTVAIAEQPMDVELRSQLGSFGAAGFDPEKKEDFVVLAPGESVTFPVKLVEDFIRWEPATREVALQYRKLGREFGLPGWIGVVKARFGAEWKEPPRNIVSAEEKWPNGNLKAKGRTLNGQRWGLWEFFNEEGDRIRTVDYTNGGTAEENPEHPSNKGKGKPAAQ